MKNLYEIFGPIGGILALSFSISGCLWKYSQNYEFKFDYHKEIDDPTSILPLNWEYKGNEFPEDESFDESYMRKKFAICNNNNWNVNIKKKHGDVYIYKNIDIPPLYDYNDNFHYLRINIRNITSNNIVMFQHKFFNDKWEFKKNNFIEKKINTNGENIFESKSLLHNNNEDITTEQIGIFISSNNNDINNIIIDEVYYGEKWNFVHISLFGFYKKTILYRRKDI
tara:strand:+ start:591 stop:1265 length:675 start_codon:yes stop_codon:yes gene_type:complete